VGLVLIASTRRAVAVALAVVAVAMALYQLAYTQMLLQSPTAHVITHLGFAITVVLLSLILRGTRRKAVSALVLLVVSLGVTGYLLVELDAILTYRTSVPAFSDLVAGTLIIGVLLICTWMIYGKTFPIVALVAIVYLVLGRFLPQPFTVPDIPYERLLMWLSVELGTGKGVYGDVLYLSATYLFLFILFGGVLDAFGGTQFIIGVGRWVGSKLSAGPAMVALVGSSLLGSVTGSTVANVTITGSFTIPMMKKSGYSPEQAGAIETVSSNGGQIMPPVMGATAFLMAGYAGIPYVEIAKAAIIPALIYFAAVTVYIVVTARKMKIIANVVEPPELRKLVADLPLFVVPLTVLVVLLVRGYTLPFVGFWSILSIVTLGTARMAVRGELWSSGRDIVWRIVDGVVSASEIAIITGLLGVVVSAIVTSGLGMKLPLAIEDLSNGNLLFALALAMIASIVLGMGVPTPAAYILVAVGAIPSLLAMGVAPLAANMFCFVAAMASHITPPVGIGSLVASKIAGGNYLRTCLEGMKAAFVNYLLPFLMVFLPGILLQGGNVAKTVVGVVAVMVLVVSTQVALSKYCLVSLGSGEWAGFGLTAILSVGVLLTGNYLLLIAAVLALVFLLILQVRKAMTVRLADGV